MHASILEPGGDCLPAPQAHACLSQPPHLPQDCPGASNFDKAWHTLIAFPAKHMGTDFCDRELVLS